MTTLESAAAKPVNSSSSSKRPHANLRSLPPNTYVDGVYSLYNPQVGTTRSGKPFLKCVLRDATGEMNARLWTFETAAFADLERAGFVWVAGSTELFNGQMQFKLDQIKAVDLGADEITALLPTTTKD